MWCPCIPIRSAQLEDPNTSPLHTRPAALKKRYPEKGSTHKKGYYEAKEK